MSFIAKAANRNVSYGGPDEFVTAKSMKHMNEALLEKVREGINIISELKAALKEAMAENARLNEKLEKLEYSNLLADINQAKERHEVMMAAYHDEVNERLLLAELNEQEDPDGVEGGTETR
jgi:hypothetical protein